VIIDVCIDVSFERHMIMIANHHRKIQSYTDGLARNAEAAEVNDNDSSLPNAPLPPGALASAA